VFSVVPWDTYFSGILPVGTNGFIVQVVDTCGTNFTYRLDGPDAIFLEEGFVPDPKYDYLVQTSEFATFARFDESKQSEGVLHCSYSLSVHATAEYEDEFETNKPLWVTIIVVMVFVFTAMVFVLYDYFVQRRQNKVLMTAQKTTAIVTSLFPKSVIKKMMEADQDLKTTQISGKDKLKSFFDGTHSGDDSRDAPNNSGDGAAGVIFKTKPIADFFPETTIMFGDIVGESIPWLIDLFSVRSSGVTRLHTFDFDLLLKGFTAWSSTREPSQVFTLLETIYHEFDQIAKSRRVFKVETVGDCYVAVAGLPDPRKDHAMIMARFARECLSTLSRLLRELEVSLGPDTADLAMRIGLHSGPVTAGVLRGDRARFQLFGDTMNMASRMESTGTPNRIQVSAAFAEHIKKANRSHWINPREDLVNVKGKGSLQTYWLEFKGDNMVRMDETGSTSFSEEESQDFTDRSSTYEDNEFRTQVNELVGGIEKGDGRLSQKAERLVDWNVDLLTTILKQIVAQRESTGAVPDSDQRLTQIENEAKDVPLDEVQEIIALPDYRRGRQCDPERIRIDAKVVEQLHIFILKIARMYHHNRKWMAVGVDIWISSFLDFSPFLISNKCAHCHFVAAAFHNFEVRAR
jgi:class 3 adenylate cyclase